MGKKYIITENQYNVILEQDNSVITNLYNRIKEKPIVKKIESLLDPDFKTFMSNVVKEFPQLKDKEQSFLSQGLKILSNPEDFIIDNQKEVDKILEEPLVEQAVGKFIISTFGVFFLLLLIYTAKYGKKIESPSKEATNILKQFEGKTLNLYNDVEEQYLYGTDRIKKMEFIDVSKKGRRNYIRVHAPYFGVYEVTCLANPDRLAPYLLRVEKETVGVGTKYMKTFTTKDPKYNKKFTDKLNEVVVQFCKVPSADFSVLQKPSNNNIA